MRELSANGTRAAPKGRGSLPFPPLSSLLPPLLGLARAEPSAPGAGHLPSRLIWLAQEGWSWGWRAYQPSQELWALLWLLPVRLGRLCGLRSQDRGQYMGTPPQSETETSAHGDTHGQAHMHPNRHAEAYTDTETHPSSAPTITRVRAHQNLQAPSLSNTEIGPETNRSAQKHKGMGTRRERSKQHTNAHLEASRAPHPGTPNPTPMHPDLHDTHPAPSARADTGIFPFKHLARPQEVTSTAAISSARSLSKYFWCPPWKCTGIKTQFHSLGFIWSWAVLTVCVLG